MLEKIKNGNSDVVEYNIIINQHKDALWPINEICCANVNTRNSRRYRPIYSAVQYLNL